MKTCLFITLMLGIVSWGFAVDFGLLLGTEGVYTDNIEPEGYSVTGTAIPWFSSALTEKTGLYLSGKIKLAYAENKDPQEPVLFEVERTEIDFRPISAVYISLGRQWFRDSGGMIASGLFDGVQGTVTIGISRLSLGVFYTGLLFKETAKILMTGSDVLRYQKPLDSPNLEGYFASRRIMASLAGEFPGLTPRTTLTIQGLAQFDVNDAPDTRLHSQYLEARFTTDPADTLHLALAGVGELIQEEAERRGSLAVSAGADWEVPGAARDIFSAQFRWAGGDINSGFRAFTSVSDITAGRVFDSRLSALMSAGASYMARVHTSFSAEGGTAYFIRTDEATQVDKDLDGSSESRFLGGELYGSLVWAPDPAFRFSAWGGAFFPQWGDAFADDAPVRWKINLGLTVSL
jgi:hypothetical protein